MRNSVSRLSRLTSRGLAGALIGMCISSAAVADDIEVFTSGVETGFRPNILFVLDNSGSMNDPADATDASQGSRIEVLRTALHNILDQNETRINAGVSIFNHHSSGILWPVSDLTQYANNLDASIPPANNLRGSDVVKSIIDNMTADGYTSTVGALNEAALYFSGGPVAAGGQLSGNNGILNPQTWSVSQARFNGDWYQPHPSTYNSSSNGTPAQYISPVSNECQANFVVMISDGQPTALSSYPELTDTVGPISSCEDLSTSIFTSGSYRTEGNCGPEVASHLFNNDQNPSYPGSNVRTYTIGFNIAEDGKEYLERLASEGDGEFFPANRPADLTTALDEILKSILGNTQSFAELSVDINKATFSDDNRIYFPHFRPSTAATWQGNLKGYFIDSQGLKDINGLLATETDANGTRFVEDAQSFWSSLPDGNKVELGGASEDLPTTNRNIYTFTGSGDPNGVNLSEAGGNHRLETNNTALDYTLLGIPDDSTLRNTLIEWLHDAPMGAALHSKSVPIRYANRTVVFQATNQGLLHAFDATSPVNPTAGDDSGGEEIFAFIPPELLPKLQHIRNNNSANGHIYGLDGGVTRWHNDFNNDGIVNGSDTLMLVVGMRRGGNNYYALDVTDPDAPKYMWNIQGGSTEFPDLAQSWSRMALITVTRQNNAERVLVFGGGYDAAVMDPVNTNTSASGNAIYMIDSAGQKIWSANHSDMNYSIPSDLRVIDSDDDGRADRIYVGDLGGQIWRIDFDDVDNSGGFTTNILATLGTNDFQPFFYPPSVALNSRASNEYLSISIGSGNRTNPMHEGSSNKLYMLKDYDVSKGTPSSGASVIKEGDLFNASNNDLGSQTASVADAAQATLETKKGWYIDLQPGEKSLSRTLTFEGKLLATTFSPQATGSAAHCTVQATTSRYYALDIKNATPVEALNNTGTDPENLTVADRSRIISTYGIPSAPIVVFPQGSHQVQVLVDRTNVSSIDQKINRVMWHPLD